MPSTEGYPFRRLWADHLIRGTTRIFWEMNPHFNEPHPHAFQLQYGTTGNANATDWVDVGLPADGVLMLDDDERRPSDFGKTLTTHYRVKLTTPTGVYVSAPVHVFGELPERDWVFAREVVRKEALRHDLVSVDGWLLKRIRYGERCTECQDPLTGGIVDSGCPVCQGTGFVAGYHPPTPLKVDMNPEAYIELLKATEPPGPSRPTEQQIRILGFPAVAKHDVWVDSKSDQRWLFHDVRNLAERRHVPLVIQVTVKLLPYTDPAYQVDVGGLDDDNSDRPLPTSGTGDTCIDHNYGGADNLAYVDPAGDPVVGATILAFTKAAYDAGARTPDLAVATGSTGANGRWEFSLCLCAGETYVLVFEKAGRFGPDAREITVAGGTVSGSVSGSVSSSVMGPQ